jgi:hypothetical protein
VRLWSVHPRCLDGIGLVACWREGLLARAVLTGKTRGYRNHPQLDRFRGHESPVDALDAYLGALVDEAGVRGYNFDRGKISTVGEVPKIPLTDGQLQYELGHLRRKVEGRSSKDIVRLTGEAHPLFELVPGDVEGWERIEKHLEVK